MSDYQYIQVERRDHLLIVTLDRPERMNALHPPAHQELERVWNEFEQDDDQWIAIITGSGDRAFSAGNDLKYQAEKGGAAVRDGMKGIRGGFAGLTRRTGMTKPIIAAVNGFALGGGFEIVLSCDIILAAETATLGLPEPRVGLIAAAGGVHRLPRHLPYHVAMGMLLTGRHVKPEEMLAYGLVNEIVPRDELMDCAFRWANQILECAPLSIRASKEAATRGLDMSLEEALSVILPEQKKMIGSEDFVEGPRAFAEKRKPHWKGR